MSKSHATESVATPPDAVVTLPASALQAMITALVEKGVQEALKVRSPDERYEEELRVQRGRNPPLEEQLVPCTSPLNGSTFTARLTRRRASDPFRVVELLDYKMPEGWDKSKANGGLVENGVQIINDVTGQYEPKFMWQTQKRYYLADNGVLIGGGEGGKPLPPQFRTDFAPAPGSVTLTPAQMAKLGFSAEQLETALSAPDEG